MEVAVDLLQNLLQAAEGNGERLGIGKKVVRAEGGKLVGGAILRPPAVGGLLEAATDAGGVLGAVPLDEPVDGLLNGFGRDTGGSHSPILASSGARGPDHTAGFSPSLTSLSSITSRCGPPPPLSGLTSSREKGSNSNGLMILP